MGWMDDMGGGKFDGNKTITIKEKLNQKYMSIQTSNPNPTQHHEEPKPKSNLHLHS
jgi:hypothetical protein